MTDCHCQCSCLLGNVAVPLSGLCLNCVQTLCCWSDSPTMPTPTDTGTFKQTLPLVHMLDPQSLARPCTPGPATSCSPLQPCSHVPARLHMLLLTRPVHVRHTPAHCPQDSAARALAGATAARKCMAARAAAAAVADAADRQQHWLQLLLLLGLVLRSWGSCWSRRQQHPNSRCGAQAAGHCNSHLQHSHSTHPETQAPAATAGGS